ncbi:MAG TPA: hypothetical protein DD638_11445 [Pasteurellaceae bacterium]|nr:hypothetical protein [Pasteurellaceae bacterium]
MQLKTWISALISGLTVATSANADIQYQHVRNATAKIHYGGATFLVDPYLANKGAYPGFEGTVNSHKPNPVIDMTQPAEEVIKGIDAVILTHTHADHWDEAAQKILPKNIPVFVQNAGDAVIVREQGFTDVRVVGKNTAFNHVRLSKTGGQHGTDNMYAVPQLAERLGDAMGVIFQAEGEKTMYIVGDTVWNYQVEQALQAYKPDVIVLNTGDARLIGFNESIIMSTSDVAKMAQAMPQADIVTVHMDAVNHATVTSDDMRKFVQENKLQKKVAVPKEGESLKY